MPGAFGSVSLDEGQGGEVDHARRSRHRRRSRARARHVPLPDRATPPTTLPLNEVVSRRPSPVTTSCGSAERLVEPDRIGDQVEAGQQLGPQCGEAPREAAGCAGTRELGDVDAELLAVAGAPARADDR